MTESIFRRRRWPVLALTAAFIMVGSAAGAQTTVRIAKQFGISYLPLTLMAAETVFGPGEHGKLDFLTVSLGHPDGFAQLMSGRSEITAHFTSAPFMYQELQDKRVRKILDSYDVLGGPHTFNLVWATARF